MRCLIVCLSLLFSYYHTCAQKEWTLSKDKDGVRIYTGSKKDSKFKSIRVQCEFTGSIDKLKTILRDVKHHPNWVYKAKNTSPVKDNTPDDIIYYMETELPWPVNNRDGVYHITMHTDSLHHSFSAVVISLKGYIAEKNGCIRILNSKATWAVTEANGKIKIDYTLEVDPAGSVPAWVVNMFSEKGPYETFKKLEVLLKKTEFAGT